MTKRYTKAVAKLAAARAELEAARIEMQLACKHERAPWGTLAIIARRLWCPNRQHVDRRIGTWQDDGLARALHQVCARGVRVRCTRMLLGAG